MLIRLQNRDMIRHRFKDKDKNKHKSDDPRRLTAARQLCQFEGRIIESGVLLWNADWHHGVLLDLPPIDEIALG